MGTKRIGNDVLEVLGAATIEGNTVRLNGQLDRKLYTRVNEVLEAVGGKWNRKSKAHVFGEDAGERLDLVLNTGMIERPQDFGFFPTPPELAARVVEECGVAEGHSVLEPSAGHGALVEAALKAGAKSVFAVELLPDNAKVLYEKFKHSSASFACGDFLQVSAPSECKNIHDAECVTFDRVVMNPPFAKRADIDHVLHAFEFLRQGGRLVSIMSAGVSFRHDHKTEDFRQFVYEHDGSIEALPEGSFKVSGTMVNTVLVTVNR